MDESIVIKGTGLKKVFNDFWGKPKVTAVNGLDLEIKKGTITGLLGPNGAGKSTLMKLLLGHLYPTAGTIEVLGKSPRDIKIKEKIGYLPERTSFYTNLTAKETLNFFAKLLGLSNKEGDLRISQLLKMVGLDDIGKRLVGEFSHGMRKRLGLAQSLLNDPDLLLLDEPTAGLDPVGCREIKDLILTLGKRGKTILLTTHLLADVQDVSDSIMIIYGGQLQAAGDINELLANKDEIIIKSSVVSDEVLQKVKDILSGENKNNDIDVSNPIRSLEDYFLSVIMEAGAKNLSTSGAQKGHGVAEFLQETPSGGESESKK
jgi:ABC-2 type transport system ATP-binding protein